MARLVSSHWFVYFYKVYANTLYIFLFCIIRHVWYGNLLEVSAPLFRVLFFFYVSDVFRGGSEDVGEYFQSFPCNLDCLSCPISLRISDLIFFRSSIIQPLVWRRLFQALGFPKVPGFLGGFPKFLERTAPQLQAASDKVFYLTSVFLVSWRRIFLGIYSLVYYRLTLVTLFLLHSVEVEIIK